MTRKKWLRASCATLGIVSMLSNTTAVYAQSTPPSNLTLQQKIALLRSKVKYVFVIFHENESFDHFFGTFPGANGLFSAPSGYTPANRTASFVQRYLDTNYNVATISPFLMPQAVQRGGYNSGGAIVPIYPADLISVDHAHQGMSNSLNVDANGVAHNDRYAMDQEGYTTDANGNIVNPDGSQPSKMTLAKKQQGETDVSHLDCDTIPFMWHWANNFVLFDNFHQTIVGPSTPNAIAMIAGQSGETQWALHPTQGAVTTYSNPNFPNPKAATYGSNVAGNSNAFVPIVNDPGPFPGSLKDPSAVKPPYNSDENAANPAPNLTFATQPLSFMGSAIGQTIKSDQNPRADLIDVQHDIFAIATKNQVVPWGWYQQGFNGHDAPDKYESTYGTGTPNPTNDPGLFSGYILHHNGPQYFGYLASNTQILANNLHGAADFTDAVNNRTLPASGGVFYLRGGYNNNDGLVPVDPTPGIQQAFLGNDDHPAYSDHQITEAFTAKAINAIANSPYWNQSAIVITYDETDGFYDHEPIARRSTFADGSPLAGGPRIPTIVISPWSLTGSISHHYSEHGSVIKFINELFDLVPLAQLPDEVNGRQLGQTRLGQANLGPSDDPSNQLGDLTEAFDYQRMTNNAPLDPSLATFPDSVVNKLPHLATDGYSPNGYTNGACKAVGILPTDFPSMAAYDAGTPIDPYPIDVNPRPTQSPGTPTSSSWTP
ncbi:MAG: alkaline phosphatase family protein [Acetobacteraceae bacterium]|nr:alkaline phosphatase family protein [Acetobacteraceae bacterium]